MKKNLKWRSITLKHEIPSRKKYVARKRYSSLNLAAKSGDDQATRSILGREAEERVRTILARIYDCPVYLGSGTNGEPDVIILSNPPIHVEVKTCELIKKCGSLGTAKGFRHSWGRLTERCRGRRMDRVYFIEWRHKTEFLYTWLDGSVIDAILEEKPDVEVFHVDFKTALNRGRMLTNTVMSVHSTPSHQRNLGDFL